MSEPVIDVATIKSEQRTSWNTVSAGWEAVLEDFERGAGVVTEALIRLAALRPGQAVLDVATGHGEPALSAARLVGSSGRVVGVDIAPEMLAIARRRAVGVDNVCFVETDLESVDQLDGRFDVVLSRFGLMFAIDHVGVFGSLAKLLVPGGVLTSAVWGPQGSQLMSRGPAALSERLELPPPAPGIPSPFSMSDSKQLAADLLSAGFDDVSVTEKIVPFRFASVEDYVRFNKRALPPQLMQTARDRLETDEIDQVLVESVQQHVDNDGELPLPSTALLLHAVAPRPAAEC